MSNDASIKRGVYDSDYFSGAQVALYIGDIWVDEVTSIAFRLSEPTTPLYGYADTLWRDTSRGQVVVGGNFSVNFKEAGYLWLVLNRYVELIKNRTPPLDYRTMRRNSSSHVAKQFNIEEQYVQDAIIEDKKKAKQDRALLALCSHYSHLRNQKILTGYSNTARGLGQKGSEMTGAEGVFETFENAIWGKSAAELDAATRRVTDKELNPFDIYITYGDYVGNDRLHHTIQKLQDVHLVSMGKQIVIDGNPIQEEYGFIARNLV